MLAAVGWLVALVTGHPPDLDPGELLDLGAVLAWRSLWAAYRNHLLGIDGAKPVAAGTLQNTRRTCWGFAVWLDPCVCAPDEAPAPCLHGRRASGHVRWDRANPRLLVAFLDRPAPRSRSGVRSANTRAVVGSTIRNLYRFAYLHGYTAKDRMATFAIPRGGQPRARSLDDDELRQVLLAAEDDPRMYVMVSLAYFAGLRCAEIAALRVEDVDLRRRWLIAHGKGGKDRAIPIHPELAAALRRYLAGRARSGPLVASLTVPWEGLTPHTVSLYLGAHIRRQQVDGEPIANSAHGLRHSFATNALEDAGEEKLYTVSKLLGHSKTAVTETVYVLRFGGQPVEVVNAVRNPRDPARPSRRS